MTPDTNLRLQSIVKAMEQVIMPALGAADPLALEQAAISLVNLKVLLEQSAYVPDYVTQCLSDLITLGRSLSACADGGEKTFAAVEGLRTGIESAVAPGQMLFTLETRRDAVAAAIDLLIDASAIDGTANFLRRSQELVLDYGQQQAARDRAWFRGTRVDPEAGTLPSPETLVSVWRATGETHDSR